MSEPSPSKVDVIYGLREAAERKALAEVAVDRDGTADARAALLDATLALEEKTQDAIDVCHECGRPHIGDDVHERRGRVGATHDNVIDVDFRQADERDPV